MSERVKWGQNWNKNEKNMPYFVVYNSIPKFKRNNMSLCLNIRYFRIFFFAFSTLRICDKFLRLYETERYYAEILGIQIVKHVIIFSEFRSRLVHRKIQYIEFNIWRQKYFINFKFITIEYMSFKWKIYGTLWCFHTNKCLDVETVLKYKCIGWHKRKNRLATK